MARHSWILALSVLEVFLSGCLASEYGWLPGKEFQFSVEGQNLAGLPQLKPQYAGFRFHGDLRIQSHSPRVLLLKVINMNYTKIHEDLPEGWWKGPQSSTRNKTRTLPLTTSTVVVKLTRTSSPELVMQSGMDDWQVNFLKGLVSNILTYMGEQSSFDRNSNRPQFPHYQGRDVFSVLEDSVVGRCEVVYEVNRLPKYLAVSYRNRNLCGKKELWEVTKTRNYSNCAVLSEDHAHLPTKGCTPGGANCGRFWTRASLTQMISCGERNSAVLLSSVTSSAITAQLHLHNNSHSVINSNLNITLLAISDLNKKFDTPPNKLTMKSLLYTYSASLKDFSSRSCQDNKNTSEDEQDTNKNQSEEGEGFYNQIDPRIKSDSDNEQKNKSEPRIKRGVKNKYGTQYKSMSVESSDENNSNSYRYQSKNRENNDENPNNFKTRSQMGKSGKRKFKPKSTEETQKPFEKSNPQPDFSEDSQEQPSEEMQLEERWMISGKESKGIPPHQPFNMFTLAHRTSYDLSCLNPKLREIIGEIASDLEEVNILPEKQTLGKLSLAVDICRSLPFDQLSSVSEEVFQGHNAASANRMKDNERRVLRDVVAMCGTHPALQLIKYWLEKGQLQGEEAAEVIASLPTHILSPTKYIVQDFFDTVRQFSQEEDSQMMVTAVLALSNLVRDACVNVRSRQHHFSSIVKPICDHNIATQVVDWLTQQLESQPQLRRVYIEAIGNVGSPDVIPILQKVALDSKYSTYLQTSAVFAMRYQVLQRNPEMVPQLMSLFHNYSLPQSTRIAASALLMYSNAGLAEWQRLAIATWYEPSPAVAQFLASSVRTMATSRDSLYASLTKSASLVLPLTRPSRVCVHRPYNLLTSWISNDLEKIILEQLTWMQFHDFTNLYYRHSSRLSGFSRTNVEASFAAANPDGLWRALRELMTSTNPNRSGRPPVSGLPRSLASIQEALGLQIRNMPQLQAELYLKFNNMVERMFLINRDTFKSWAKGGRRVVSNLQQKEGMSMLYQRAGMNNFHISTTTELGFPVEFSLRTPWMVRAKADFNVTNEGLVAGAAFMYSSQLQSSVSVMSAWDNIAHSAGAFATNFLQLPPFRVTVVPDRSTDRTTDAVKVTSAYIDQHRLLFAAMQPFTSQSRLKIHQATLLNPDTWRLRLGDSIQMPIPWMSRYLNSVYSTEQVENFNPMDFIQQTQTVVGFPLLMPNMEARSFETVMNPLHPVIMNFSMSMASKSMGLLELNSPSNTILSELFNALAKTEWSIPHPTRTTVKPGVANPANSTTEQEGEQKSSRQSSPGQHTDNSEPNSEKKSKHSPDEEKPSIDISPAFPGIFKVYSTTYDSATDSFNASLIDPFENTVNGSGHYYLIDQIMAKINSGKAMVVGFSMKSSNPEQPIKIAAYTVYATTLSKRASRVGFFLNTDNLGSKILSTAVLEAPVDIASDLSRRVTEDLLHRVFVDYVDLRPGQSFRFFIQAKLGMSRARLAEMRADPMVRDCSQNLDAAVDLKCHQLQAQAREIGFGNITVYYNDGIKPTLEKTVRKYVNTAAVMLPRTEERPGTGANTLHFTFNVQPRTDSLDTQVITPIGGVNISRTPLSDLPMPTLIEWAMQDHPKEYCGLSNQRVRTFDGAQFQQRMENSNWYLMARDCSNKYGFSVLVQASSNKTMSVEVNIDDHFVLTLEEGPRVSVNYKQQPLNASQALLLLSDRRGNTLAHTVFTPDESIHVNLPEHKLDLVYSGSSVILHADQGLQGRMCGLCGSYSSPGMEQFLTAQGVHAKSPLEFSSSYMLKDSKPQHMSVDN